MSQELELNELAASFAVTNWTSFAQLGIDPFGQKYERTHTAKPILRRYMTNRRRKSWMQQPLKSVLPDGLWRSGNG